MTNRLFLQNFFEFLYDFIVKKGRAFLYERLDREEYLRVRSMRKIMNFVETGSLEDKIILCSKLGLRTALVLWDDDNIKYKKVHQILIDYLDVPVHEMTRQIINDKVFAAMDIDFLKSVMLVSKASHSQHYSINRKYLAVKDIARFRNPALREKIAAEQNMEWYVKTIEFAMNLQSLLEGYKLNTELFKILLCLYNCPNGALVTLLQTKVSFPAKTRRYLTRMQDMNLIRFDLSNKEVVFIHTYGLMLLEKVISKFP